MTLKKFWSWLERRLETQDDAIPNHADVLIGCDLGLSKDGTRSSPQSQAIAFKVMDMFLQGKADNVLFSGGYTLGSLTGAEAMANFVADNVPRERIFLQTASWYTFQDADFALPILQRHGWKTAVIITQQWTARRVRRIYQKRWQGSGIQFSVVKARSPYGGNAMIRWNHFLLAVAWDLLGWLHGKLHGHI